MGQGWWAGCCSRKLEVAGGRRWSSREGVYCIMCTVYVVLCTVYSVQSTVYTVQSTVYSIPGRRWPIRSATLPFFTFSITAPNLRTHCVLCTVYCELYNVLYSVYSVLYSVYSATCLSTRIEEFSLVLQSFWQPSFCRKHNLWNLCFFGGNWLVLLFSAFLEERWSIVKLEGWWMDLSSLFFFSIEAVNRISILVLPSKQRLHKLCFLQ